MLIRLSTRGNAVSGTTYSPGVAVPATAPAGWMSPPRIPLPGAMAPARLLAALAIALIEIPPEAGCNRRTELLLASATYTFPLDATATAEGPLRVAATAAPPSPEYPRTPDPATGAISPFTSTLRTRGNSEVRLNLCSRNPASSPYCTRSAGDMSGASGNLPFTNAAARSR